MSTTASLIKNLFSSPPLCGVLIGFIVTSGTCVADEPSIAVVMVLDSARSEVTLDDFGHDVVIRRPPNQETPSTAPQDIEPLPFFGEPLTLEQGTLLQIRSGQLMVRLSSVSGSTYDITGDGATITIMPEIAQGYIQLEYGIVLVRSHRESGVETGLVNSWCSNDPI